MAEQDNRAIPSRLCAMTIFRRTSRQLSCLILLSSVFVLGAPLMARASVPNPTAASILAAAKTALAQENGVHVKVVTFAGKVNSTLVADIGKASGSEAYVSGNETFTITVTPTYAYLSGSASGLTKLIGLTSAEQKKVGKSSMTMKKGTTEYTTFQSDMTSGAFDQLLPAVKGTTLLSKRDKSTNGYRLTWTAKATTSVPKTKTTMVFSSGKTTLPLSDSVTNADSTSTTTFSKWGEAVQVKIPTSTITYAKVFSTK
jgi:hypothetical protein